MSSHELPFRLVRNKTTIILLFFFKSLLFLRYIFFVSHDYIYSVTRTFMTPLSVRTI